jgi:hypothetical protein
MKSLTSRKAVGPIVWAALAVGAAGWTSARSLVRASEPLDGPRVDHGATPPDPGADSVTPLSDVAREARACADCLQIVYAWTPRMPLSRLGIENALSAGEALGIRVTLVSHEELQARAEQEPGPGHTAITDAILDAGVLAHAPALVVMRGEAVLGTAILGYKRADAYVSLVSSRLAGRDVGYPAAPTAYARIARHVTAPQVPTDYQVVGLPGAYFRWVPYTRLIAYESDDRIYLLDLADGQSRVAPGFVDFVPTPDGRYFVTPGPGGEGLEFFDAREVLDAVGDGRGHAVQPIFNDERMRDQYPSMGILQRDGSRTRYRVLTSWFEGLRYRDYDVTVNPTGGASSVRPVGEPVVPCQGIRLSTPIMSQSGLEVAARDESTGTTKIFEMLEGGACREVADLGAATSKVAWHASGQKLAFSTPRRGTAGGEQGIFVFDRRTRTTVRVPASETASRLAFPDFLGEEAVVFLVPSEGYGGTSFFRVVDGIE